MDLRVVGQQVLSKVVQNYALEKAGVLDKVLSSNDNLVTRSLKSGAIWYFANEANDLVMGKPSNLVEMNVDKLVDDVAYFSLATMVAQNMQLYDTVENLNPLNNIVSQDINEALISGVIQTAAEYVGDNVLSNVPNAGVQKIRHMSQFFK